MRQVIYGFAIVASAANLWGQGPTAEQAAFFETSVRPVLVERCASCHSKSGLGGLSVASREDLLHGGTTGPAIVPGDPEKSLLITAILQRTDLKMPKGGKLADAEIVNLTKWVKDGAYWPAAPKDVKPGTGSAAKTITPQQRNFWSFRPLTNPAPPAVKDEKWPYNAVDRFILARLEKEQLAPAPLAERRTLLRRVTYALTGLMPTYDEVQAFEHDKSPNAYEKVVDRLQASPHYGERWGRLWLDIARYSEDNYRTPGMNVAPDRTERFPFAFEYRDWVIGALNADMPYDRFVKVQLAADQMPDGAKDIRALGFNGLGVWHWDADPPEVERASEWNDKVDATTRGLLGLTVACARCHDHKYDPIQQKDYYRLSSIFASSDSHSYPLVDKGIVDAYEVKKKRLTDKEQELQKFKTDAADLLAKTMFERTEDYMLAAWRLGAGSGSDLSAAAKANDLDELQLQRWVHFLKKPPVNYPYLKAWQEMVVKGGSEEEAKKLAAQFHAEAIKVVGIHDKLVAELAADQAKNAGGGGKFDLLPNGSRRRLSKRGGGASKGLEREPGYLWKDLFLEDLPDYPLGVDSLVNGTPPPGLFVYRDEELKQKVGSQFASHIVRLETEVADMKKAMPPQYPFAYGLADKAEPEDVNIQLRGSPYSPGDLAPRGFLAVLSPEGGQDFKNGSGRLELAEAIAKQPLAQRVIVNRIWRWLMGSGLVETPSNFGAMGERPSNPELLEYLTSRFAANGLSWKKLQKEILMSRTFQLSSSVPLEQARVNESKDTGNRLYWRANRRRLDAEGIWDVLLETSGNLDLTKQGGTSESLTDEMNHRGVFAKVSRMNPDVFQQTWDFPVATLSSEGRLTTNVPPQQLFFLNSTVIYRRAADLAKQVGEQGTLDEQIRKAYRLAYEREPAPLEVATIERIVQQPVDAGRAKVAADGDAPSQLKSVCWAVLSSNELLYVD